VRPPRGILNLVGASRWITALTTYPHPREISGLVGASRWTAAFTTYPHLHGTTIRAVYGGCHKRARVLKHTSRHQKGNHLPAPTIFILPKIVLLFPLDQQDTVLIPLTADPTSLEAASLVHLLRINVPLAKLTLGSIGPARSLPLRTRYRHIRHLRRFPIPVLVPHNQPRSRRNLRHSRPGEISKQRSRQISSARRPITKSLAVVRTSYLPVTALVRHRLGVTPRHLHAGRPCPSP